MAMEAGAKMGSMTTFFGYGAMYDPYDRRSRRQPAAADDDGPRARARSSSTRPVAGSCTAATRTTTSRTASARSTSATRDSRTRDRAGSSSAPSVKDSVQIMSVSPTDPAPDWIAQANTIRELAERIGVDPDTLEETVTRYNKHAENGEDPEWGDPTQTPVVAGFESGRHEPVVGPPYYAIQQWPGTLGTNGGCRIDADARVLGVAYRDHRRAVRGGERECRSARRRVLRRWHPDRLERDVRVPRRPPRRRPRSP